MRTNDLSHRDRAASLVAGLPPFGADWSRPVAALARPKSFPQLADSSLNPSHDLSISCAAGCCSSHSCHATQPELNRSDAAAAGLSGVATEVSISGVDIV